MTEYESNLRFFKDDIKMNNYRNQDIYQLETQRRFLDDGVTEGDLIDAQSVYDSTIKQSIL